MKTTVTWVAVQAYCMVAATATMSLMYSASCAISLKRQSSFIRQTTNPYPFQLRVVTLQTSFKISPNQDYPETPGSHRFTIVPALGKQKTIVAGRLQTDLSQTFPRFRRVNRRVSYRRFAFFYPG